MYNLQSSKKNDEKFQNLIQDSLQFKFWLNTSNFDNILCKNHENSFQNLIQDSLKKNMLCSIKKLLLFFKTKSKYDSEILNTIDYYNKLYSALCACAFKNKSFHHRITNDQYPTKEIKLEVNYRNLNTFLRMLRDEYRMLIENLDNWWSNVTKQKLALLLALTCVVHFDLLGLFLAHPYGRRIVYTDNEQQQYQPRSELDHIWIPRPGTDPNTLYFIPQPVILPVNVDDGDDYWTDSDDDYWTQSDDDVGGAHNNRGTLSDDEVHQQEPAPDTVVVSVPTTITTETPFACTTSCFVSVCHVNI
ncbi:hypothetical protein ACI65C_000423 [Semiaphis heraclei]